jgi:hypothetical protein
MGLFAPKRHTDKTGDRGTIRRNMCDGHTTTNYRKYPREDSNLQPIE